MNDATAARAARRRRRHVDGLRKRALPGAEVLDVRSPFDAAPDPLESVVAAAASYARASWEATECPNCAGSPEAEAEADEARGDLERAILAAAEQINQRRREDDHDD